MDTSSETTKKTSLEDLSREELISKCKTLLSFAQKAKHAKNQLIEENDKLKEQLNKQKSFSSEEVIGKLTQQKVDLLTSLEELKSQKNHLDSKFSQCESNLYKAESKISELDTTNQSYKRRVDRLTEENEQLLIHLDGLEKQIEELKTVGLQQQQQLLVLEKNKLVLSQTNQELNKNDSHLIELQNMLSVSLEEVKYLKVENSNLNEQLNSYESSIKESKEISVELAEKKKIIDSLQLKLTDSKNLNNATEEITEENMKLHEKILKLQSHLEESEEMNNSLKQELNNKNIEIEMNANIVDDLKTDLHKNKALVEKLNQDIFHINNKLADNQIMSSGVASDLQNANDKLRERLKLYHSKIVKLANDTKQLKQSKIELLLSFKTYTTQVSEWKERLNLLLNKIECQDKENNEIVLQNRLYRQSIDEKIKENEILLEKGKKYDAYKEDFEELIALNKSMKDEINILQVESENADKQHLRISQEKEELHKEFQNFEDRYVKGLDEFNKLQEKYYENVQDNSKLKKEIASLQEKLLKITKDKFALESFIDNLEGKYLSCKNDLRTLQNSRQFIEQENEESVRKTQNDHENQKIKFLELQNQFEESTGKLCKEQEILKKDIEKYIEENRMLTDNEESMKSEIHNLKNEFDALKSIHEETLENVDSLYQKLNQFNAIIEEKEERINDLIAVNSNEKKFTKKLKKELSNLKKDHEEIVVKIKQLEENTSTLTIVESLNQKLNQCNAVIEEKEETIKEYVTLNNNLNAVNLSEKQLTENLQKELLNLGKENEELVTKIKELEEETSTIPTVESLNQKLNECNTVIEEKEEKIREYITLNNVNLNEKQLTETLKEKMSNLGKENEELVTKIKQLEEETSIIPTVESLNQKLNECNTIIEEKEERIKEYVAKNNDLNAVNLTEKQLTEKLQKELSNLEKEKDDLLMKIEKLEEDTSTRETVESLNKKLNECNAIIEEKEETIKEYVAMNNDLNAVNLSEKQLTEKFQKELLNLGKENEELGIKIKQLEEKTSIIPTVESLNQKLIECNTIIEENEQRIKEYVAANNDLNAVNLSEKQLTEKLNEELLNLVKENKELLMKIKELEEKLLTSETDVQTVNEIKNLEEMVNSLKRENTELLSEMNEMNQVLKERGETISEQEALQEEILKKMQNYEKHVNDNENILISKNEAIENLKKELNSLKCDNESNAINMDISKKSEEINQLKLEVQELQQKLASTQNEMLLETSYAESENMSTSTISKSEEKDRMKDLDSSWEERYAKLRKLAVKQKGKIRDLEMEIQKEQGEKSEFQQKHAKTIQTFQNQIDKLQDDYEASKNECKQYLKKLDSVALDVSKDKKQLTENDELISKLKSEIDGLNKDKITTENWKKQIGAKAQALKKELEANNLLKKDFENRINKLNVELESKDKALKQEIEKHNQTKAILQESNNECKKQSVLNLEMHDYERSVKELSQKIDKKQELISKLKSQLETQKTTLNATKEQNVELQESVKNSDDLCDKIKSENEFNKKKITEFENFLMEKDNKLQDQTYMIENIRSENEDLSTQLSKTIAENQKNHNTLKEECDILKSRNMGLEQTLRQIQDGFKLKEQECSEMQKEYDGYKVRAQSVLRQSHSRDVGVEEKLTQEAASLRAQVDILTSELNELRSNLDKTIIENNQLQSRIQELNEKVVTLETSNEEHTKSFEQLSTKHNQTIAEHTESIRALKIHSETLAQCYRQQLAEQETRHNREVIELQSKMDKCNTPPETSLILPSMPREEGEGSESVESVTNNSLLPIPLEKLLNSETEHEIVSMKKQLSENESKVVHLTALLSDTEQDLAKYVQLNKVLKEEIRRQQRSAEREKHAENLEYLKNVVFKFITLGNGDERTRLVPVLNTILKLSPEETQKLNNVAKGEKAWSNYLPISWGSPNKPQ